MPPWIAGRRQHRGSNGSRSTLRQPDDADPQQPRGPVPRHGDRGRDGLPRHPQRRHRARRGGGRGPAGADRGGTPPAALRDRGAAGAQPAAQPVDARLPRSASWSWAPDDVYEMPAELDFTDLKPIADLNIPQAPLRALDAGPAAGPGGRGRGHLQRHPQRRRAGRTPVRELHRERRAVHQGRRRPTRRCWRSRCRSTAPAADTPFLPHADPRRRGQKQVAVPGRAEGPLRRGAEHPGRDALENAGVHVVYGIVGLKTHAKTTLVVRQDPDGIRCYAHIGTGNYNAADRAALHRPGPARPATRTSPHDVVELFHYLTGRSLQARLPASCWWRRSTCATASWR